MAIRIDAVLFYQLCSKDRERGSKLGWRNIKQELQDDMYEVKETDGSLSYAFVDHGPCGFLEVLWMDEREYELHLYDMEQNARLDAIMNFEPDEDLDQ